MAVAEQSWPLWSLGGFVVEERHFPPGRVFDVHSVRFGNQRIFIINSQNSPFFFFQPQHNPVAATFEPRILRNISQRRPGRWSRLRVNYSMGEGARARAIVCRCDAQCRSSRMGDNDVV